jgi:hypothetical protein
VAFNLVERVADDQRRTYRAFHGLAKVGGGIVELGRTRDDMIVSVTAAILDLHRLLIQRGQQTKQDAINRLMVQKDLLVANSPGQKGAAYLQSLIETLADDELDAAKLLRDPPPALPRPLSQIALPILRHRAVLRRADQHRRDLLVLVPRETRADGGHEELQLGVLARVLDRSS